MKPTCIACGSELTLLRAGSPNYTWTCTRHCPPSIDTGVPASADITRFEQQVAPEGNFCAAAFASPIRDSHVPAAKVFAAQVLYHFIECTWGGCYNSIYQRFLVPHLDSPSAVDYVLRSDVVRLTPDAMVGANGARIYPELLFRLRGVASQQIKEYLRETFPAAVPL